MVVLKGPIMTTPCRKYLRKLRIYGFINICKAILLRLFFTLHFLLLLVFSQYIYMRLYKCLFVGDTLLQSNQQ